jgi:hypothetical protein
MRGPIKKKKAAGVESGGAKKRASISSGFDGVRPLVANFLAGNDQPVFLRQRAARAHHGPRGVRLPAHRGHNLLQCCAAFAFKYGDRLAGLASFPWCAGVGGRLALFFLPSGLPLRGSRLRRDVGRVWRNGRSRGEIGAVRNGRFRLSFLNPFGNGNRFRSIFGNRRRFVDGSRWSPAQALDRFPDPRYGGRAVLELPGRGFAGQTVPDFDRAGSGSVGRQLRQLGFAAEAFGIGDGFGRFRRVVNGDVVGFVFNRKRLHRCGPFAAETAVTTFIAGVAGRSKRILREIAAERRSPLPDGEER